MSDATKKACLLYVPATATRVRDTRAMLEQQGYTVCEAEAADAAVVDGASPLTQPVLDCIAGADLCVFLLPEDSADDGCLGNAAGAAEVNETRVIGVYVGQRTQFPQPFDEHAESLVRAEGPNLAEAFSGVAIWEKPDGQRAPEREIVRVRCQ